MITVNELCGEMPPEGTQARAWWDKCQATVRKARIAPSLGIMLGTVLIGAALAALATGNRKRR